MLNEFPFQNAVPTLTGIGVHTGKPGSVHFAPGREGGLRFVRTDIKASIPALCANTISSDLSTTLSHEHIHMRTVEHVLSAIHGLGITDLDIFVEGEELPILDGSAKPFVDALIGITILPAASLEVDHVTELKFPNKYIKVSPSENLRITYHLQIGDTIQSFDYQHSRDAYGVEIASARTFCLSSEWTAMRQNGLGIGSSADSGFVIVNDDSALHTIAKDLGLTDIKQYLHFCSPLPILSKEPPRYENEPVRHKILDIIGDFALLGKPLKGHIEAFGTGHTENLVMVRKIAAEYGIKK